MKKILSASLAVIALGLTAQAAVNISGSATTSAAITGGSAGFPSDFDSLSLGMGSITSSASAGNDDGNANSFATSTFGAVTDMSGMVVISGSALSYAYAQDFNLVTPASTAHANISAFIELTDSYAYVMTSSGNVSGSFSGSGVLPAGVYSLAADSVSSASINSFFNDSTSSSDSANFSLELTPVNGVPEVGSGTIMGAAIFALVGFHGVRRQRKLA